jgi:outer membrane protein OmpA-like peptidoglycan-associated protein
MDTGNILIVGVITIVILFGVFMLIRELMCWYWKINESLGIQKEIKNYLQILADNITKQNIPGADNIVSQRTFSDDELMDKEQLMKKYEIRFENNKYWFKNYSYDALKDAVKFAKKTFFI